MSDQSPMSDPKNCEGSASAISSPGSADGATPCGSPAGPTTDLFGRAVAPVSRSRRRESARARQTPGTCGRSSIGSSASAALQSCLGSRLKRRFDSAGSMEYSLTWKDRATPAGRPFCLLRASGRRISGTGFGGWPTPMGVPESEASHGQVCGTMRDKMNRLLAGWPTPHGNSTTGAGTQGRDGGMNLQTAVQLAGWATPKAREQCQQNSGDSYAALSKQVQLAGWGTPTSRDHKDGDCLNAKVPVNVLLGRQALGATSISSGAGTGKPGALNPAHSRWLMGFPPEWDACGVTAMPSCRKSRRSS